MISKFNVPNPCSESWNGMQPRENGRYCDSCQKVVLDLTNKTNEEILAIITANAGKKLCGTFRTSQLVPAPPPADTDNRTIRFLAAALFIFGMTLFSCSSGGPEAPSATKTLPDTTTLPLKAPNANDPYFLIPEPGRENENEKESENEEEKKTGVEKDYPVPEIINEGGPHTTITGDIEVAPEEVHNGAQ